MTIRGYVALFYGACAIAISLFGSECWFGGCAGHADIHAGMIVGTAEPAAETAPLAPRVPEDADLPSYMTEDPEKLAGMTLPGQRPLAVR